MPIYKISVFSGGPRQNYFFSIFLTLPHIPGSLGIKIRNCLLFLTLLSKNIHSVVYEWPLISFQAIPFWIFKGFENLILCISFHLFFVFYNLEASSVVNSKSVRKKILNYLLESFKGGYYFTLVPSAFLMFSNFCKSNFVHFFSSLSFLLKTITVRWENSK